MTRALRSRSDESEEHCESIMDWCNENGNRNGREVGDGRWGRGILVGMGRW